MDRNREQLVLPDLIGYEVNEALKLIEPLGLSVKVQITKPIFAAKPIGVARVVRLRHLEDASLQVVVAYQDYQKGGA